MMLDEFADWQNYHAALFRGFGDWMLGINASGHNEPQEIANLREQAWFEALGEWDGQTVKAASMRLWKTPPDQRPAGYSDHLAALVEILRRSANEPEPMRRVVACARCQDTGIVEATSVPGMAVFTVGGLPMPHGCYSAVDCDCRRAASYPEDFTGPRRARWDEGRMMTRPAPDESRSWEIIDAMRERGERHRAAAWERFLRGGALPQSEVAAAVQTFVPRPTSARTPTGPTSGRSGHEA